MTGSVELGEAATALALLLLEDGEGGFPDVERGNTSEGASVMVPVDRRPPQRALLCAGLSDERER